MQMNKRTFQRRTLKETVLYRVLPHDMKWASKTERLTRATEQFLALFFKGTNKKSESVNREGSCIRKE